MLLEEQPVVHPPIFSHILTFSPISSSRHNKLTYLCLYHIKILELKKITKRYYFLSIRAQIAMMSNFCLFLLLLLPYLQSGFVWFPKKCLELLVGSLFSNKVFVLLHKLVKGIRKEKKKQEYSKLLLVKGPFTCHVKNRMTTIHDIV